MVSGDHSAAAATRRRNQMANVQGITHTAIYLLQILSPSSRRRGQLLPSPPPKHYRPAKKSHNKKPKASDDARQQNPKVSDPAVKDGTAFLCRGRSSAQQQVSPRAGAGAGSLPESYDGSPLRLHALDAYFLKWSF